MALPPNEEWGKPLKVIAGTNHLGQRDLRVVFEGVTMHWVKVEPGYWKVYCREHKNPAVLQAVDTAHVPDEIIMELVTEGNLAERLLDDTSDLQAWVSVSNAEFN